MLKRIKVCALSIVVSLVVFLASPTVAHAALGDAKVTYYASKSIKGVTVCSKFSKGKCIGSAKYLYGKQNTWSKFGWRDADAFRMPARSSCSVSSPWYGNHVYYNTGKDSKWRTLSGMWGETYRISCSKI